ncbi:MAG: RsmB/NOP family class I SAM-dependent RNA methyltransferase [Lachnospiraceae bacterium]|nr:RsmB/NOP family class I SAM-dependent RNA methyltransferase [Lachnospiraceae bacterium]
MSSLRERLPRDFVFRMKEQLGEETDDFLACYDKKANTGIRINTGRLSVEDAAAGLPFTDKDVPWLNNGFYLNRDAEASRHPYYYAGLYYIQEPSAMLPASRLPIEPGDMVLDLCAAPGGKATELASRLNGTGLLVANDVSASRAKALVKNLTVWGAANICITAEQPQRLLKAFGCCFDKILVDAPCSGEGMFRKDPSLITAWEEKGPESYAPLQKEILSCAVQMLKPGGMLLYSTCTFSVEEDEAVIAFALEHFPELELVPLEKEPGFSDGIVLSSRDDSEPFASDLRRCVRIYPHRVRGEGHFLALLKKKSNEDMESGDFTENCNYLKLCSASGRSRQGTCGQTAVIPDDAAGFLTRICGSVVRIRPQNHEGSQDTFKLRKVDASCEAFSGMRGRLQNILASYHFEQIGEQCLLVPPYRLPGQIRYLRTGLLLGTLKRGRFEPSQALAMMLDASCFDAVLDLSCEDERVVRYLKGETLEVRNEELADLTKILQLSGDKTVLICVDGHGLGWGKLANGSIRNRFYPGWRMQ